MKSFRHYHRKWRIWHNKFGISKLVKKITPLMLAVLMSKNVDGQGLPLFGSFQFGDDFVSQVIMEKYLHYPVFCDIDGDGDKDLFSIVDERSYDGYNIKYKYFINRGTPQFAKFNYLEDYISSPEIDTFLASSNIIKIDGFKTVFDVEYIGSKKYIKNRSFKDLDSDGDLDIIIYPYEGDVPYVIEVTKFFKNVGSITSPVFDTIPFVELDKSYQVDDLDLDGNFDIFFLDADDRNVKYFINKGSLGEAIFDFDDVRIIDLHDTVNKILSINFFDFDGDEKRDLSIITKNKEDEFERYYYIHGVYYLRNSNDIKYDTLPHEFINESNFNECKRFIDLQLVQIDSDGEPEVIFDNTVSGPYGGSDICNIFDIKGYLDAAFVGNVNIDLDGDGDYTEIENYNSKDIITLDSYGNPYLQTINYHKLTDYPMVLENNNYIFPINESGEFTVFTLDGTQKIYPKSVPNFEFEPPFYTYDFPVDTNITVSNVQFVMKPITGRYDVAVDISGLATRPGFETKQYLYYKNLAGNPTNGTLSFTPPAELTVLSAQPNYDRTVSGVYYWDIEDLQALESEQVEVNLQVDVNAVLNTPIQSVVGFEVINGTDFNPLNNTDTLFGRITGSFDPNDKLVTPTGLDGGLTAVTDQPFEYTIRFQNMGNDTAFTVIITDTLDIDFNLSSFEMVGSSHHYELSVRDNNVLIWKFRNILLPPSSTNLTGSQGFVKYRFTPKEGADIGTIFTNQADIYFDYNTPVVTNETKNIFGVISGIHNHQHQQDIVSKAYPNPTKNKLLIEFNNVEKQDVIITIYDIEGQQILQKTIQEGFFSFDVHNLSAGTYLYTIESVSAFGKGKFIKE